MKKKYTIFCPTCGAYMLEDPKRLKDWLYCNCGFARPTIRFLDRQPLIKADHEYPKKNKYIPK